MATYNVVSTAIPSTMRMAQITDIAAGDRVDVAAILGRPANGLRFVTSDEADSVSYRINNYLTLIRPNPELDGYGGSAFMTDSVRVWSNATDVFTEVGLYIELPTGLRISSFEVTAVTLATGTTITAIVW